MIAVASTDQSVGRCGHTCCWASSVRFRAERSSGVGWSSLDEGDQSVEQRRLLTGVRPTPRPRPPGVAEVDAVAERRHRSRLRPQPGAGVTVQPQASLEPSAPSPSTTAPARPTTTTTPPPESSMSAAMANLTEVVTSGQRQGTIDQAGEDLLHQAEDVMRGASTEARPWRPGRPGRRNVPRDASTTLRHYHHSSGFTAVHPHWPTAGCSVQRAAGRRCGPGQPRLLVSAPEGALATR
jgi:hypothetical protein